MGLQLKAPWEDRQELLLLPEARHTLITQINIKQEGREHAAPAENLGIYGSGRAGWCHRTNISDTQE